MQPTIEQLQAQIEELKRAAQPKGLPIKLDLGCGTKKQPGFVGVDSIAFPGVDVVCDLSGATWPWPDGSVEEAHCAQMVEHIPTKEVGWELASAEETPVLDQGIPRPPRLFLKKVVRYPRAHFFNELWRVLKTGGKATIVTPHWCSGREYGDPTHEWAPVSEWTWPYLDKEWRATQAPHTMSIYTCDFTAGYGYNIAPWLQGRNQEYVQEALMQKKEAAQDMICTLVKR